MSIHVWPILPLLFRNGYFSMAEAVKHAERADVFYRNIILRSRKIRFSCLGTHKCAPKLYRITLTYSHKAACTTSSWGQKSHDATHITCVKWTRHHRYCDMIHEEIIVTMKERFIYLMLNSVSRRLIIKLNVSTCEPLDLKCRYQNFILNGVSS